MPQMFPSIGRGVIEGGGRVEARLELTQPGLAPTVRVNERNVRGMHRPALLQQARPRPVFQRDARLIVIEVLEPIPGNYPFTTSVYCSKILVGQ
jgi:hypothetical protein